MFESIGRSFALVQTSWQILMQDKKLLAFPILSGILSLIVLATFILPLLLTDALRGSVHGGSLFFYGALFLFYLVSYFVVIFFNTALITSVHAKLNGKDMSIGEALSVSLKHAHTILAWALVSATIGLLLHMLEERAGFVGEIAATLIGGAWGLVTFFVVPVLVLEDKGVFASLKESVSLIRKTWGESIVGTGSIMVIFFIVGALAFLCLLGTMFLGNAVLFWVALALFIAFVLILAVVAAAMQGIFVTALYQYAKTGTVPSAFDRDLIQNAFGPRPAMQSGLTGPGNI